MRDALKEISDENCFSKKKASDSKRALWLNAHWKVSAGNVDELFSYIYLYIYIKTILGSSKWIWGPFTCTSCYCNPSLIKETYFFDLQSICKKDSWLIFSLDDFIWVELERKCKVNYGRRGTSEVTMYMTAGGRVGPIIRGEVVSVPPGAHTQRCSKRWRREGRWWRRRRWPTRSTVSADSPRSCAGSAGPCWCRPQPPTGVP